MSNIFENKGAFAATIVVAASDSLNRGAANYVCDGVADNVEIQAAINALPANGGKIQLSEGTFNISATIVFPIVKSVALVGMGRGAEYPSRNAQTVIFVANGSNCDAISIATPLNSSEFANGSIIRDLMIDGNKTNNASGHGLNITYLRAGLIENVWAYNCKQNGFHKDRPGGAPAYSDDWCTYRDIMSIANDGHGGYFRGTQDGGFFENCWFNSNAGRGLDLNGLFRGWLNHVCAEHNGDEGFFFAGVYEMFMKIRSWDNANTGVYIEGSFDLCLDIISIFNAKTAGDSELFLNGSYRNIINLRATTSNVINRVGLKLQNPCINNVITPNIVVTNTGTGIYFGSTDPANAAGITIANGYIGAPSGSPFGGASSNIWNLAHIYDQHSDLFMDVLAASTNHVVAAADLTAAPPIVCGIAAQPDVPRNITITITDGDASISAFQIDVVGVNAKGQAATEQFLFAGGLVQTGNVAWATITSITVTSITGDNAGDILDVGIGIKLGLSNEIYATSDVYKIKKNNANALVAVAQVNATYDTYDMAVIGLAVGDDFTVYFKSNLNIVS